MWKLTQFAFFFFLFLCSRIDSFYLRFPSLSQDEQDVLIDALHHNSFLLFSVATLSTSGKMGQMGKKGESKPFR
jgi:hypothetical protein